MALYRDKYRIESARLKGFDYATPGEYFVTAGTDSMVELFGDVAKGIMVRNDLGEIAHRCWLEIPKHHHNVRLDEFIVMPNHVHGILVLLDPSRDVACNVSTLEPHTTTGDISVQAKNMFMSLISPKRGSLGSVVRSYKSAVTNWYHKHGHQDSVWEPRFYDHVIRGRIELFAIRNYIRNNPRNWSRETIQITNASSR